MVPVFAISIARSRPMLLLKISVRVKPGRTHATRIPSGPRATAVAG
jgi:hypothetical protein